MAKTPPKNQEPEAEEEAPAPKKKGKKLLLIGVVLLVIAAGAGTWFFAFPSEGSAKTEARPTRPSGPPVFVNLDPFTVNLQPEDGEQYLQVVATLRVLDAATGETVKTYMPEIRHRILLLLSGKRASEVSSIEGRERLADELRRETDLVIWAAQGITPEPDEAATPIGEAPEEAEADGGAPAQAAAPAAGETAPAALPGAAPTDPVQSVLFTSFIIQ